MRRAHANKPFPQRMLLPLERNLLAFDPSALCSGRKLAAAAVPEGVLLRGVHQLIWSRIQNAGWKIVHPASSGNRRLQQSAHCLVWARLESARNNKVGFAAPNLYSLAPGVLEAVPGFHDITVGCNGAYCATPYCATLGWDFTTGLGTFNVWDINQLLLPTPK
jgi:pseudomonalisin